MKKKNGFKDAIFVTTPVTRNYMFSRFIKKKVAFKPVTKNHMFCQFMNKKNHSNVTFVTAVVLKRVTLIDILHQFMKKKVL